MNDLYSDFCNKIKESEPYCFSRWGDGEWNCILGVEGQNCDGHTYFRDLGERLAQILRKRQKYFLGLQSFALQKMGGRIAEWLQKNTFKKRWINADVFHDASKDERLETLFKVLRQRNVILVGPAHLKKIDTFEPVGFVEVPLRNCWLDYHNIISHLIASYAELQQYDPVVLICSGMPGKVMVDEMSDIQGMTCIDLGSALDPYVGVKSRRYHKEMV